MSLQTWLIYLVATFGLALSPGPNGLLALTHGALHGARKTSFTILGGATGFAVVIALSMFGIGALLQSSVVWLTVLKWVGGAYLVWLGIQVWRAPPIGMNESMVAGQRSGASMFREGALSALTNPKAILFFAAFLPQFIDPQRDLWVQFVILSATFVGVEIAYEFFVAAMAARIRPWLRRVGKTFNRVCGGFFVALGAALPLRG
jgi:threonine/homoserine/homoserine lactone efflux protein